MDRNSGSRSLAAIVSVAVLLGVSSLRFALARWLVAGLFSIVLFFVTKDIFIDFPKIKITQDFPKVNDPGFVWVIEIILFLGALAVGWLALTKERLRLIVVAGCVAFGASDAVGKIGDSRNVNSSLHVRAEVDLTPQQREQKRPNVYHVIFDGFGSQVWEQTAEAMGVEDQFDGFVFFNSTKANYFPTGPSVASVMGSELYGLDTTDLPYRLWWDDWRSDGDGILGNFHDFGYRVSQYTDRPISSARFSSGTLLNGTFLAKRDKIATIVSIVAARMAPAAFREQAFEAVRGSVTSSIPERDMSKFEGTVQPLDFYLWNSVDVFEHMLADETSRESQNEYVFSHLFLPHGPFDVNSDCEPFLGGWPDAAACSVKLMSDLISKLKQEGRYKDSLIIFHADHGNHFFPLDDELLESIESAESSIEGLVSITPHAPAPYDSAYLRLVLMTNPLLLIKPPGMDQPGVRIRSDLTELVDIGPTLYGLSGLAVATKRGRNLFDEQLAPIEEISIFVQPEMWRANITAPDDQKYKHITKQGLPHLSYNSKYLTWRFIDVLELEQ